MDRPDVNYYRHENEGTTDSRYPPSSLCAPGPSTGPLHAPHTHYHNVTTFNSQSSYPAHPTHQIYPPAPDPLYFLPPQNQYQDGRTYDPSFVSSHTNVSHSHVSTGSYKSYSDQQSDKIELEYASLQGGGYTRCYPGPNVIPHGYADQQHCYHPPGEQEHLPNTGNSLSRSTQDSSLTSHASRPLDVRDYQVTPSVVGYSSAGPPRVDFTDDAGVQGIDFGNRGGVDDKTHTLQSAGREEQHQLDSHVYQVPEDLGNAQHKLSTSMNVSVHEGYMEQGSSVNTKQDEAGSSHVSSSHVSTVDSFGSSHVSTVDSSGSSHVCTVDSSDRTHVSTVDSSGSSHVSTVDSSGSSHVSTVDSSGSSHVSTVDSSGSSHVSTVDSSGSSHVSTVDSSDRTHVSNTHETHISKVDGGDVTRGVLFRSKVHVFVAKYSGMWDTVKEMRGEQLTTPTLHNSQDEDSYKYAEPDALEFLMQVSPALRERRFFKLVEPGDVVEGHVVSKSNKELNVQITSFVGSHKLRELSDINVMGLVVFDNLSDDKQEKIWNEMRPRDVVQGIVISQQDGLLNLSFKESHVKQLCSEGKLPTGVHLGYIEGKRPASQKSISVHSDAFLRHLESDPGFSNPSCTNNLKAILGIRSIGSEISGIEPLGPGMRPTLFKNVQTAQYLKGDYCHALRKAQRSKWSMDTVAVGVQHFKSGDHNKAMKLFNHALEIDPDNVEGLVARGALYANGGKFKDGIKDFEKALTVKHSHKNARKYLVETQVAYGEELEKRGKMEEATRCYKEALADDPSQRTARQRLEVLTAIMERQAAERRERERKKDEEEKTLKKIQKLLERERDKKSKKKSKMKKAKKSSKTVRRKSSASTKKSSKKRRKESQSYRDYSSSESDESTLSDTSRSRSRSISSSRRGTRTYHRSDRDNRRSKHSRSQSRDQSPYSSKQRDKYSRDSRSPTLSRSHDKQESRSTRYKSGSQASSPHRERDKKYRDSHSRSLSPQDERRSRSYNSHSRSPPVRIKEGGTRRHFVSRSRSRSQSRTGN